MVELILDDPQFARVRDELALMVRNSIRIRTTPVDEADLALGESRIGGCPDLPLDFAWPTGKLNVPPPSPGFLASRGPDEPRLPPDGIICLPFIGQLRMEDLKPFDLDNLLPTSGMLYFFYNNVLYCSDTGASDHPVLDMVSGYGYDYYDYLSPENWQVIYCDRACELTRTALPESIPREARYSAYALTFSSEPTLPHVETCFIGDSPTSTSGQPGELPLTAEEWDSYCQIAYDARANDRIYQLLGYSDDDQPYAMEGGYDRVTEGFFGETTPPKSVTPEQRHEEWTRCRLLLQVDNGDNGMWFGRGGRLFFFMRDQDLESRRFENAWAVTQ